MKNFIFISIFLLSTLLTKAQITTVLDTIYANDTKNVALFFPEPIKQGITGSDNFVFTYNREKQQYFGLLQAKPGVESNLLVLNNDGSVFSYIIRYKKELSKLNYFIPSSCSIGNERPIRIDEIQTVASNVNLNNRAYYYQKFSSYFIKSKQRIGRIKERNEDIVLSIENIVFDKDELYFVIQIENNSTMDYDINFLDFYTETRKKGKKKSLQRLYKQPIYIHQKPLKIKEYETVKIVYVMPKFSLSRERRAFLELNEKDGERNIKLKISHKHINNPN